MCRVGGTGIENHWVNYSTPFQNTLPQRRLEVGSYLPSTARQKLAGSTEIELRSLDSESRVLTITPWNQAVARARAK